jgi:hypothetical protein
MAASPPERRSQELSGGGCKPVDEPTPLSPRLMAGLSSSASAGPIGCTSGLWALDFGVLPGFFGLLGFFVIDRIWDESGVQGRAKHRRINGLQRTFDVTGTRRCRLAALSAAVSTVERRGTCDARGPGQRGLLSHHREKRSDEAIHSFFRDMDCFAEPVIGRRFVPTRWLAITRGDMASLIQIDKTSLQCYYDNRLHEKQVMPCPPT